MHWREPDRGIWEVRGEPKHFTSSKIMCWVACDRGARLARLREDDEQADALAGGRRRDPRRRARANGVDDRGVFIQHYDTDALDASLLLAPLVRFLPPDDERIVDTVNAIADELTVDGLVLRYRVEETDDGLSGEEGTFAICSFWLVSALAEIGETRAGAGAVREAPRLREPARPLRRGDRPALGPPPRATSRRRSRTWRSSTRSCTSSAPTTSSRSAASRSTRAGATRCARSRSRRDALP